MSNPLKKTMVYLGLADEELEYQAPAGAQGAANNGSTNHGTTNHVSAVPARGHDASHSNAAHGNAAQNSAGRAPVTPLRTTSSPQNVAASEMNEILTVHPRAYKDAQVIAESFREGVPVIINLSQMSDGDARRLIDFASGLSQGLYGKIERVTAKVFLLSPSHVVLSGDSTTEEGAEDSSFFAQG